MMMTELKKVVVEMQKQVGKCSQYCKHYRCPDVSYISSPEYEMYCDHPLSCDAEDIIDEADMGLDKLCIFWEGNIGHCKKHDVVFVGECPECATDYYYDWLNEVKKMSEKEKEEEKEETEASRDEKREMENLTPHDITIVDEDCEEVKTIPASGKVVRVEMSTKKIGELGEIPITTTTITDGTVELPPLHDKKMYIVSRVVASALPDRKDLLFPDQLVRDEDGRVIGCKSLSTLNPDIQRGGIDEHHL